MSLSTPATATLDELVFVGRNQAYGAFDLRRHYRPTLSRALWLGVGLFLASLLGPSLYVRLAPPAADVALVEATFTPLASPPDVPPVSIPPAASAPTHPTIRALPPLVVPADDIVEEHSPPTVEELDQAVTGPKPPKEPESPTSSSPLKKPPRPKRN